MKTWNVRLEQSREAEWEIEADTEEEAKSIALEDAKTANEYDWDQRETYILGVVEVGDGVV